MAKIPEYYNIGDREELTNERMLEIIEDIYKQLAVAVNKKPDFYERNTDGLVTDTFLNNGDINLNSLTGGVEFLTAHPTQTSVTWSSSGGSGSITAYATVARGGALLKGSGLTPSHLSAGRYRLTFDSIQSDTYYSVVATPAVPDGISVWSITVGTKTNSYFDIKINSLGDVFVNPSSFSVIVVS